MKKLLIMVMAAILLVGCSSSKSPEGTGGKVASSKMTEKDEKKDKGKDGKKSDSDREDKTKSEPSDEDITIDKPTSDSKSGNSSTTKKSTSQNTSSSTSNKTETPSEPNKPTPPPVTPPPVQEPTPAAPTNQSVMADQVFVQINAYRQQNGKEPFQLSNALKMTSEAHALNMANVEGLWHSGDAVECITNADDPFRAWVNSPPHNEILLCNNTEGAVGIYYYNGYYYSVFQCQYR